MIIVVVIIIIILIITITIIVVSTMHHIISYHPYIRGYTKPYLWTEDLRIINLGR